VTEQEGRGGRDHSCGAFDAGEKRGLNTARTFDYLAEGGNDPGPGILRPFAGRQNGNRSKSRRREITWREDFEGT